MLKTGRHYAGWENLKIRGIEPDLERHSLAMSRADFFGLSLRIDPCVAEDLPLPTNSVDAVVSTCTLCTVDDPQKTLAQVRRVPALPGQDRMWPFGIIWAATRHIMIPKSRFRLGLGVQPAARSPLTVTGVFLCYHELELVRVRTVMMTMMFTAGCRPAGERN